MGRLPLEGVRVIDLTHSAAGPFATSILGDLGADVTKVESPEGDMTRTWGHVIREGVSTYYLAMNRNKHVIRLDLKNESDRNKLYEMIKGADVLIENYRPGVAERLGVDYDTVSILNPRIIYVSIKGFMPGSEYEDYPAFDIVIQGMSGLMSVTGCEDGTFVKVGVPITDMVTGFFSVIAILSALRVRDRDGKGVRITVPMLDSALYIMGIHLLYYFLVGDVPRPLGTKYMSVVAPYQGFKARDGKMFILAVGNDRIWRRFCEVIGRPELADDPRFRTNPDRVKNQDELEKVLQEVFLTRDRDDWVSLFLSNGIPAGPVYDMADLARDNYVNKYVLTEVNHPELGTLRLVRGPIRFNGESTDVRFIEY
ncbi:L-carnitine dehydratase/bile acid-inducible protein F [Vulcanisaeta moutnovskia 768-28]|uniref:L-carnitine dehydratase/bile acid-inducible protein F n=1 Tax=Vulcanisaeta moutnovskia (strain 768-28) TaxID=985053 RepID=F0QWU2_VULM7|nr:CoA transferase [Vulcanisaeta moutnovskia]ADY01060.1 L-carnitine dehydratase/bile acid-inducible protein F [Vulcanisaeta moutnovskia 768-28]